jgi:hypothetical protein
MSSGGVTLTEEQIRGALSRSDMMARTAGNEFVSKYPDWCDRIEYLSSADCPVTYLPVLAILLTARSMKDSSELDVLDIQQQTGPRGYAASSIGRILIPFATEQGVDLRSRSSQVLNNQPFTFEPRITPGMTKRKPEQFAQFYESARAANDLTSEEAAEILAIIFHVRRVTATERPRYEAPEISWEDVLRCFREWARFVDEHSDNGKVGVAFVASMLGLLYGDSDVMMGHNSDPDASTPGDVQVVQNLEPWVWSEVKQKPVTTGDIQTFIEKVRAAGGIRILYCALANGKYPKNLDQDRLIKEARSKSIGLVIVESPAELIDLLLHLAPGAPGRIVATMAEFMSARLIEAGASPDVVSSLEALNGQLTDNSTKL